MAQLLENYLPGIRENGFQTNEAATLGGALSVTGQATLTTLTVTGTSTLTGNVTASGTLTSKKSLVTVTSPATSTVLTAAQSGAVVVFNSTTGILVTLPAPATGLQFEFVVAKGPASGSHKIITDAGTTFLYGGIQAVQATGNATLGTFFTGDGAANVAVTMNGTTTGGTTGTYYRAVCTSSTLWAIEGVNAGTGTLATPFANS